jgi:hypothetical protein
MVELYAQCHIHLHGMVLNKLNTGITYLYSNFLHPITFIFEDNIVKE